MVDLARLIRLGLAVLVCLAFGQAHAQALQYPSVGRAVITPAPLNTGTINGVRAISLVNGDVKVLDSFVGKVAANDINIQQGRVLTKGGVIRALGAAGSRALPAVALATGLAATYCELGGDGWLCDVLQPKQTVPAICWRGPNSGYPSTQACLPDWQEASKADTLHQLQLWGYIFDGWSTCAQNFNATSGWCYAFYREIPGGNRSQATVTVFKRSENIQQCPLVGGVVGVPDPITGNCPTGLLQPATDPQIDTRIVPRVQPQLEPVVNEALARGVSLAPAHNPAQDTLTGPATVTEPAKTSTLTSPSGAPLTKTETVTHAVTYSPTTNSYNYTTTTIINNYDGTTETKTEERPEEDTRTECEKNPQSLNCAELDTPDVDDLQRQDLPVSVSPDGGWGSDSASCPAPVSVSVLGHAVVVDNSLMCQFFGGIRPVVIAVFGLAAAMIFVGGLKQ